jgi:hypothetical protein
VIWLVVAAGLIVWAALVGLVVAFFAFGSRNEQSAPPQLKEPEPTAQPSQRLSRNGGGKAH